MPHCHPRRLLRYVLACSVLLVPASNLRSQDPTAATVRVLAHHGSVPLPDAIVRAGRGGTTTDSAGRALLRVAPGAQLLTITRLGYRPDTLRLVLAAGQDTTVRVDLVPQAAALAGIVVMSTRAERRLEEEPLDVAVLAGDDVSEKSEMRSADLRTLFSEMSGVRVQTDLFRARRGGAAGAGAPRPIHARAWLASTVNGRCDASSAYGTICTHRASLLARAGDVLSVRASAGGGWFAPMALDEETEVIGLARVTQPAPLEPERARTASLDVTDVALEDDESGASIAAELF